MKKIAFGFAAALALGVAAFGAPASAASPQPAGIASHATDFSSQGFRRDRGFRRGPVCTVRTEVRRGPMGRRIVSKTRVCR